MERWFTFGSVKQIVVVVVVKEEVTVLSFLSTLHSSKPGLNLFDLLLVPYSTPPPSSPFLFHSLCSSSAMRWCRVSIPWSICL